MKAQKLINKKFIKGTNRLFFTMFLFHIVVKICKQTNSNNIFYIINSYYKFIKIYTYIIIN